MKSNLISSQVGMYLRKTRKEKNMTGKQLARLINVSQQQISRYETGCSSLSLEKLDEMLVVLDKRWIEMIYYIDSFSEEKRKSTISNKEMIQILLSNIKGI
ncbi:MULTISPECIES: helix-turn-helix domain-containing protein [Providencia]|uniref:helix-turn-helix domain-containing protein n=1 Tax=Providencia TaxID=586 RepID=UPI0024AA15EA|nr:helix-turn-helix transcriptional regulator [Providencia rettgeri]